MQEWDPGSDVGATSQRGSNGVVNGALRHAKRVVVLVVGGSVLVVGVAMIVLPGPAFVFIPAGLAILATEFLWARRMLNKVTEQITRQRKRHAARRSG
jgi:uncharacterized protein (TIGR02611 family)